MTDKLIFDFGKVFIYNHYLIVIVNEGEILVPAHNDILLNIVETYFKNKPFVYITHRINSYSVDTAIYNETSKIKNLEGFAVVSKDFKKKHIAEIEGLFIDKPFKIFDTIDQAVTWAEKLLTLNP